MADHDYSDDYVNNPGTQTFTLTEEEAEVILGMRAKHIKCVNLAKTSHSERLLAYQLAGKLNIYLRQFSREELADKLGTTIVEVNEIVARLPNNYSLLLDKAVDACDCIWLLRLADALDFHIRTSADSPDDLERQRRAIEFLPPNLS